MVTLFLEQLKLRPHAQCFQQFDAKVKPGKIGYSDVEKVTVIFAVNAVNKARTTQKSSAFLDGFWDIFAIDSYGWSLLIQLI